MGVASFWELQIMQHIKARFNLSPDQVQPEKDQYLSPPVLQGCTQCDLSNRVQPILSKMRGKRS